MYCMYCRKKVDDNSVYCIYCGHALNYDKIQTRLEKEIEQLLNEKSSLEDKILEETRMFELKKKELNTDINLLFKQKERINLEGERTELKQVQKQLKEAKNQQKKLLEDINKLQFQKEMLLSELEELESKQYEISQSINNPLNLDTSKLSIEYIDNLQTGVEFEQYIAYVLNLLKYSNISITSSSGDFGIDVLATKDDVCYGFQCKLYSKPVGNSAIQEAFAGKSHYNCNVAIVVTNSNFTEQAKKQAQENRVILWDRNTLIRKLKNANK